MDIKVRGGIFHKNNMGKSKKKGEKKLSGLRCVSYHAIHTKVTGGIWLPRPPPEAEVIRTRVYNVSGLWCVSYHDIDKKVTGGILHQQPFPTPHHRRQGYQDWGKISYQVYDMWVIMLFTQKVTKRIFHQPPSPHPVTKFTKRLGCISYQVYEVWVTVLLI